VPRREETDILLKDCRLPSPRSIVPFPRIVKGVINVMGCEPVNKKVVIGIFTGSDRLGMKVFANTESNSDGVKYVGPSAIASIKSVTEPLLLWVMVIPLWKAFWST
jgi:hypothetical protein